MRKGFLLIWLCFLLGLAGCENTDVWMATEAGLDAVKAMTLSDEEILELARRAAEHADGSHKIAPRENTHAVRLHRLVGDHLQEGELRFNYKVYLADEVNAFAMADGTIRIYSGLMDMLDDGELRFVVGHEMGHVAKDHIKKKVQLAYAASALRKGIASQGGVIGEIARSHLGGLVETLMNAQFSQLEEKEADDYGLSFLKNKGYEPNDAVSALKKLATLGSGHSFLSSHPDPENRAERLKLQLEGKALSIEENRKNLIEKITASLAGWIAALLEKLRDYIPWFQM